MSLSTATDSWESWEEDEEVTPKSSQPELCILLTSAPPLRLSLNASGTSSGEKRTASTRNSERKDEISANLGHELDGNILEIKTTSFFNTFLGGISGTLDEKCLQALRDPESISFKEVLESQLQAEWSAVGSKHPDGESFEAIRTAVLKHMPFYDHEETQFRHLAEAKYEDNMYKPLTSLLNFISYFYRFHLKAQDGMGNFDQEWPEATQTWPRVAVENDGPSPAEIVSSSQPHKPYLRRRFFDLAQKPPKYTNTEGRSSFVPDLALVLCASEDPRLPDPLGWRDIKVAIEVKRDFETPHIQTARYARCMKLEQFDRNFIFTLSITGEQFRITRWDTAACYVTPPINFHKDPCTFIRVVGRLASMNPTQLGYDPTFSNAGRVLYSQARESNRGIRTILTVTPCSVSENLQISPRTQNAQAVEYLLDDEMLCDARDLLLCRSTRVWRAQLITDEGLAPEYNAIKQNWHDESRTNEAWFYEETKDIELGIAHMRYFEDVYRTRDASSLIGPDDVRATWTRGPKGKIALQRNPEAFGLENVCHRALVRFVLKEVGKPLSKLRTPKQLVQVVRDIAVVLETLYERNILHRDISEGNILLSYEDDPAPGNRAFLTDFGLAMKVEPASKLPPSGSLKHKHMTGTLPFMAAVFHQATRGFMPLSMIHHDIESLFWVAMYTLFKFARHEELPNMPKKDTTNFQQCGVFLTHLQSPNIAVLFAIKKQIMDFGPEVRLPGRWHSIQGFLSKVASLCANRLGVAMTALVSESDPDPRSHDIHAIIHEAEAVDGGSSPDLDALAPLRSAEERSRVSSLSASQLPGLSGRPATTTNKRKNDDNDHGVDVDGLLDQVPSPRNHSKRFCTGTSNQADQGSGAES